MDRNKFDLYLQIWDIGKTIGEGLAYLDEHPEDEQVFADVRAGLQVIQSYVEKAIPNLPEQFSAGNLTQKMFLETIVDCVVKELDTLLQSVQYIERLEAKRLFCLWEEIPHATAAVYQWMFNVCMKASVCAARESFNYTIKMLEEQPGLLSSEGMLHPGYVYRPSEQKTFDKCPICGGDGLPYFRAFAYQMSDFEFPHLPVKLWMKCESCGNLYTWKYPEELLALSNYEKEILPEADMALNATGVTNGGILAIWSDILQELQKFSGGNTLLDIGIGKGELLAVALEFGFQVDGVEIVPEYAQKVSNILGISIWCCDFLKYHPDKTYSIIIMGDVLEHVTDPEQALRNVYRLLADDGVLWLSTPNYESSFSRMQKFNDAMWMEPYHISYFSKSGLEKLLSKCGFILKRYNVSRRYNGSMELILTKGCKEASQ